jgi:UPF0288 family protein (methanogenesis marker protein 3)
MLMNMAIKMLAPQLEKLTNVISDLTRDNNTAKALLVMSNELDSNGKETAVLMVMGFDNGKMHLLIDKQGKPMKYPISELGNIIAGGIND